jgi:hypothetical protein
MKKVVLFLFLSLILLACKKGAGTFVLCGEITDETFQSKLSGAKVVLFKVPAGSSNQIAVDSMILGDDGKYTFSFPREQIEKYIVKVSKEGYFDLSEDIYYSALSLDYENIRDYSTTAKSWVGIQLMNQNPESSDHLTYIKQEGKQNCLECCPLTEQNFYGATDTTIYCINNGNEAYSIFYWVNGTSTQEIVSQITPAFDTSYITITY